MISADLHTIAYKTHSKDDPGVPVMVATVASVHEESSFPVPNLAEINQVQSVPLNIRHSQIQREYSEPLTWTRQLEDKFYRLAQKDALHQLSLAGRIELERLVAYRRQLKNPRTGEEVVAEYEQRMLTRNLVVALSQYVKWHKQYSKDSSR
jgi:hypothetical protein